MARTIFSASWKGVLVLTEPRPPQVRRWVEYGVFERSPGDWEWTYYPKVGIGMKTQGSTKGSSVNNG
jgi:hypothetical protein